MQAALTQLQETDASLTELATRLGYDSDAAFSRAFKRIVGVAPGAVRRNARMQPHDADTQSKSNISNSDFFLRRAS
jgi:AraC-like DNA-binding protein